MLAIVLAVAAAVAFGASDYAAGLATRAANVFRVSVAAQATSLGLTLLIAPWAGSPHLTAASAGWGALAGVAGDFGAVTLYLGFRHAAFSVASTISAVGSAALSVAAGLAFGERPTVLALVGIALALPAIAGVSASPGTADAEPPSEAGASRSEIGAPRSEAGAPRTYTGRHLAGVGYGLLAGAGFALYFVGLNRAGSGSGLWPVVVGQAAGLLILLIVAVVTREAGPPPPGSRLLSVATGVTGTAGALLFFIGSHRGLLAITAVITSLYPAGTILLARVALGERLSRIRLLGLVLAGASVALIAVAGA